MQCQSLAQSVPWDATCSPNGVSHIFDVYMQEADWGNHNYTIYNTYPNVLLMLEGLYMVLMPSDPEILILHSSSSCIADQ